MQIYIIPSRPFLAIFSRGWVRIYGFLFIRFRRVWFMGVVVVVVVVVKFQLLLEVRVYSL